MERYRSDITLAEGGTLGMSTVIDPFEAFAAALWKRHPNNPDVQAERRKAVEVECFRAIAEGRTGPLDEYKNLEDLRSLRRQVRK